MLHLGLVILADEVALLHSTRESHSGQTWEYFMGNPLLDALKKTKQQW